MTHPDIPQDVPEDDPVVPGGLPVRIDASGIAVLALPAPGATQRRGPDEAAFTEAVREAASGALAVPGIRRVEVGVPTDDRGARRALHRSGFRLEGVLRDVSRRDHDGASVDVAMYSLLAGDETGGGSGFSAVMNTILPTKRVIAHVLFRNRAGKYLFVSEAFKEDWELPGGIVEPHEPPLLAARRECEEELGLALDFSRLLVIDWMPPYLGWDDAMEMIYDGGVLEDDQIAAIVPQASEITAIHWVDPEEALAHLIPGAQRRFRAILDLPVGGFAYLEHGRRVQGSPAGSIQDEPAPGPSR